MEHKKLLVSSTKNGLKSLKNIGNILVLGLFLSYSFYAHASRFIDIDEFELVNEKSVKKELVGKKGLRAILYDTDAQKFLQVNYHNTSVPPQIQISLLQLDDVSISILADGNIEVAAPKATLKGYTFRTIGDLTLKYINEEDKERVVPKKEATQKAFIRGVAPSTITAQGIVEQLKIFNEKKSVEPFNIFFSNYDKHGKLLEHTQEIFKALGITERGKLGELATEFTMIHFAYKRLPSQTNRGSNGFDGVYYNGESGSEDRALFLTESKCRNEDVSAESYMEWDLSEYVIFKRLEMASYHDSANLIDDFMTNFPENIFKVIHRIKEDGTSQYCLEKFNIHQYRLIFQSDLSQASSEKKKQMAVAHLMDRLNISSEDMINFVNQVSVIPKEEVRKMGFTRTHNIPASVFGEYSMDKLKKLVNLIHNEDKSLQHVPVDKHVMLDLIQTKGLGLNISMGPIEKLFGQQQQPLGDFTGQRIWNVIIQNLDGICIDYQIDKGGILNAFSQH